MLRENKIHFCDTGFITKSVQDVLNSSEWNNATYIDRLKNFDENEHFLVEGYAVSWNNIDLAYDIMMPNSMDNILTKFYNKELEIKYLDQHNRSNLPLGTIIGLKKDENGLKFIAKCNKEGKGKEAFKNIEMMFKDNIKNYLGNSFNYHVEKASYKTINGKEVRVIEDVSGCDEISLVTYPCNQKAIITAYKSEGANQAIKINTQLLKKLIAKEFNMKKEKANDLVLNFYKTQSMPFKSKIETLENSIKSLESELLEHKSNNKQEQTLSKEEAENKFFESFLSEMENKKNKDKIAEDKSFDELLNIIE